MVYGIDISTWQRNYPYSTATKAGVKFAIIRAGYSTTKDDMVETHYKNAKAQGWGVGAYWYSYAKNTAQAEAEARAFLKVIEGKEFDYPLYLDIEDPSMKNLGSSTLEAICRTFGEIIENAGYYFGIYCNTDWFLNKVNGHKLAKAYDFWIAQWSTKEPTVPHGMWQFGGSTNFLKSPRIGGVTTDQNYALKNYPAIIRGAGLNHLGKKPASKPASKPVATIKEGSSVKLKAGAKTYNGQTLAPFVFPRTYKVIELAGNRAVIAYNGVVVAAVHVNNLRLV